MISGNFFSYSWSIDDKEKEKTIIRIYGLDEKNNSTCLIVEDFTPYIYIQLPVEIDWNDSKAGLLIQRINYLFSGQTERTAAINYQLMFKKKLYYANMDKKGNRKLYPFLFCNFYHIEDIKYLNARIRKPLNIPGLGTIYLKIHENNASSILQLTSLRKIPTAGWISFRGKSIEEDDKQTYAKNEYIVSYRNLSEKNLNTVGRPLLLGYDIEVYSSIPSSMPKAERPLDKIFQISMVFARQGSKPETYEKILLSLGKPNETQLGDDIKSIPCDTEADLLVKFTEIINERQPNIIIGYNIFTFDIPYMIDRAKHTLCFTEFSRQGMDKMGYAKESTIEWSSSAYKNQSFQFLDVEGRIFVDLLPLVKRDYKMNNYKLKTISSYFLKDMTKDPLDAQGIFKCYKLGMTGTEKGSRALAICGKYCVKDSELVVRLFETLTSWIALCEMSKLTNVPIFSLFTRGQQLKVFSQAYKKCTHENTVVERDAYITKENDFFLGATVIPPLPGVYTNVVPFDFCLTGDTLVSHPSGYSKRIENMNTDEMVLGLDGESYGNFSSINGLQVKGIRDTVKIWLEDGTTIVSTPDHKFMLENGEWCKAEDLKDKFVRCGPEFTEDIIGDDEEKWSLEVDGFCFDLKENREKTLGFMRILGYILTDGCIYMSTKNTRKCAEVYLGTIIDAENFVRDLCKISTIIPAIRKRDSKLKGTIYCINIPQKVANMIHSIDGIIVGKRSTQAMKLPKFLFDNCPLSVIREFLGGLYGGDGVAPFLTKTESLGCISFKWTTIEKFIPEMVFVFEQLQILMKKLGLETMLRNPKKINYGTQCIIPKDAKENPRYDIAISVNDADIFLSKIGFRYCINKSYKLSLAASYCRMCRKTREQHNKVLDRTNELFNSVKYTTRVALEIARKEVFKNEPIINFYSELSVKDIGYQRHEQIRHSDKDRKLSLQPKHFPTFQKFLQQTNTLAWFDKKSYSVIRDNKTIPYFRKRVIDVKPDKPQPVFDIEVDKVHNFLANGVLASNCSLYPSSIIAYNISWDTLVLDDNIPDEKCHIMSWSDHSKCVHCPKEIRIKELVEILKRKEEEINKIRKERDTTKDKNFKEECKKRIEEKKLEMKPYRDERSNLQKSRGKHVICAERQFRWLKEPQGVLPEILVSLLDGRKNTKKEMKAAKEKLKEFQEGTDEYFQAATYVDILDQRQLALKVSANSAYGCLGAKTGYMPFMPGAMCTTYVGRKAIEKAAKAITTNWGGVLVYGDSVTGDTPVLVRYQNETINVQAINTLGKEWIDYDQFRCDEFGRIEKEQSAVNLEVWTNGKWSKIKRVIRHKTEKEIYRVSTERGIVDVTEDHSLLRPDCTKTIPKEVKVGEELLHSFPEYFIEFDTTIIEGEMKTNNTNINTLTNEDSYILGYLFASCVLVDNSLLIYTKNEYFKRLLLSKGVSFLDTDYAILIQDKETVKKYEHLLFDDTKNKIVPYPILNASKSLKKSFLRGYNGVGITYEDYSSNGATSQVASQGLYVLLKSVDKNINKNAGQKIKKIEKLDIKPEYVYDLETEEGIFAAGVGEIVVKNTDSNYVNFPECKTISDVWEHSVKVAEEVSKLFPKPMSLAFEEKVYYRFFILTKKRYMSLEAEKDGKLKTDGNGKVAISKKGVLLQRRDNSNFVRKVYGDIVMKIFEKEERDHILLFILDEINKLCSHTYPNSEFIITKSVGDVKDLEITENFENDKKSIKIGDYKVRELSSDEKKRAQQLSKKNVDNEEDYYIKSLPAVVQLSEKMKKRGQLVSAGSRIEYVITTEGGNKANQNEKIESYEYFVKHTNSIKLDFLYYLKQLSNPVDQILDIMYNKDDGNKYKFKSGFVLNQYKYCLQKQKVLAEIENLSVPKIVFCD
jgi:DNA polymerase elongation subunit (family B)